MIMGTVMERTNIRIGKVDDSGPVTRIYSGAKWLPLPRYVKILEDVATVNGWAYEPALPIRRDNSGAYIRLLIARAPRNGPAIQFHLIWRIGLTGWGSPSASRKTGTGKNAAWETITTLADVRAAIEEWPVIRG